MIRVFEKLSFYPSFLASYEFIIRLISYHSDNCHQFFNVLTDYIGKLTVYVFENV